MNEICRFKNVKMEDFEKQLESRFLHLSRMCYDFQLLKSSFYLWVTWYFHQDRMLDIYVFGSPLKLPSKMFSKNKAINQWAQVSIDICGNIYLLKFYCFKIRLSYFKIFFKRIGHYNFELFPLLLQWLCSYLHLC